MARAAAQLLTTTLSATSLPRDGADALPWAGSLHSPDGDPMFGAVPMSCTASDV